MSKEKKVNTKRNKAKSIYIKHLGKIALIDIANKLDVSDSTVRGWKRKDKWDIALEDHKRSKGVSTENDIEYNSEDETSEEQIDETQNETKTLNEEENDIEEVKRSKKVKTDRDRAIENEGKDVKSNLKLIEEYGLNYNEAMFAINYVKSHNATKSYSRAYGITGPCAATQGSRLKRKENVAAFIKEIENNVLEDAMLKKENIVSKMIDIAFSDMADYCTWGTKTVLEVKGKGKKKEVREITYNYVHLKNYEDVDSSLIEEISEGKDGVKIKLISKWQALNWLAKYFGCLSFSEKVDLSIKINKAKPDTDSKSNPAAEAAKRFALRKAQDVANNQDTQPLTPQQQKEQVISAVDAIKDEISKMPIEE